MYSDGGAGAWEGVEDEGVRWKRRRENGIRKCLVYEADEEAEEKRAMG